MASKIDETQNRAANQPFKLQNSKDSTSNLIDMNLNKLAITNNSQAQPSNSALLSQISDFTPAQPALTYFNTNTTNGTQSQNNFSNNSPMSSNSFGQAVPQVRPNYSDSQNNVQQTPQQTWPGMRPMGANNANTAYKPMGMMQPQAQQQPNSQMGFFGNLALPPPPQPAQTLIPSQAKSAQSNTGKKTAFDDLADLLG